MAIFTSENLKSVLLQAEIEGVLQDVLAITNVDNVYYTESGQEKKLSAKIAEIMAAIGNRPEGTAITQEIKTATDTLYNKIMGIANLETTVNEAYDTLKEVADYLTAHGDVVQGFTTDISGLKTAVQTLQNSLVQVEASTTNGNIRVNGEEVQVYQHPEKHSADIIEDSATKVMMKKEEREKLQGVQEGASAIVLW